MKPRAWNAGQLIELSGYFWKTGTLHAGVKLDIFTIIGDRRMGAAEIARKLDGAVKGVERLLNALTAMDLLEKTDDGYANLASVTALLSKDSGGYIGHIILHHHHLVPSWVQLDQAVRSGNPVRTRASFSDEQWRKNFLMGMFNLAMGLAPQIVAVVDLSGCRHLLDLGGGPGTYAIHFCRHNPGLEATVFDLPTTRPFAEKTIAAFNLTQRIRFMEGDYLNDEINGRYDAIWLSHILHAEGPRQCQALIGKAVNALEPGGSIFVHDFFLNDRLDGPLFPALFSLNMLLGTDYGQSYCEGQVVDMLTNAGVRDVQRIPVTLPNDSGIITGVV